MESIESQDKNSSNEGLLGSHVPVRDGKFKQNEIQRSPTAEELFEASSLFEADDEITEMIEKIAHSILFDDVLDELKETVPLLAETKESPSTDGKTLTDHGRIHCQESISATTRKEAVKPESTESNRISDLLLERSRERTSNSCEALRANISEVCQNIATEYSLNLLKELAQDFYADLSNDNCELLLYVTELFHKEVLDFGNEHLESLLRHFDKGAQNFSYGLIGELVNWFDDGFTKDRCELNSEFDEQMKKFTNIAEQNLIPLYDIKIKRFGGLLGNAIEVRLQSDEVLQASKERKNDFNAVLPELDEAGNGVWGIETGVRLHEAEDPKAIHERNTDSNKVLTELDEAGICVLGKETEVRLHEAEDPKASNEINAASDEVATEIHEAENGESGKESDTNKDPQVSNERNTAFDEVATELDEAENGETERESDTAKDRQASNERNTASDEVATELDEAENGESEKESDTAKDPQASNERNTASDEVATELDEAENEELGKEPDNPKDLQASGDRNKDSVEVPTELGKENEQTATSMLEREIQLSAVINKKDKDTQKKDRKAKGKKKSLRRLWYRVKRVFCCISVAEGDE